jgi:hypothetical protein
MLSYAEDGKFQAQTQGQRLRLRGNGLRLAYFRAVSAIHPQRKWITVREYTQRISGPLPPNFPASSMRPAG